MACRRAEIRRQVRRGWLAIDPKGLLGERTFDFVNILRNPDAAAALTPGRFDRQVEVLAAAASVERRRLLELDAGLRRPVGGVASGRRHAGRSRSRSRRPRADSIRSSQQLAEETMRGVTFHRRTFRRDHELPRSHAGPGRSGARDEGLRHVRLRPASIPPAEERAAAQARASRRAPIRSSPATSPAASSRRSGPASAPRKRKVGDRVMVHHYQGCTQCSHCRSGWQQLCQEVPVKVYGNNAHGGHAQVPEGAGQHAGAAAGEL